MNRTEHLLTIAAEEAVEVAHRVTKALRFSLLEVQPGQRENNAERIVAEYVDLIAVMEMLMEEGALPLPPDSRERINAKKAKVERFLAYSRELGTLQDTQEPAP